MPNTKPFVAGAFVCERILHEKDNVLSAIRIVDTFYVDQKHLQVMPTNIHAGMEINVLIMVKSGDVVGDGTITLKVRSPLNKTVELPQSFPVHLNGGEHGANVHVVVGMAVRSIDIGLFWIDVYWNGEPLTSVPFKLVPGAKPVPPGPGTS